MLRKLVIVTIVALVFAGCSKKDAVRPNPDSELAKASFEAVEGARAAYVKRDFDALSGYFSDEGYRQIRRELGDFSKVVLKFSPRWVSIEDEKLTLNVAWQGTWSVFGGDKTGRGMAVFVMDARTNKFEKVLRSNPFRVPE